MSEAKNITVLERKYRKSKNNRTSYMKEVKTDGTQDGADKAVEKLKKSASDYFEVHNSETGKKAVYKKLLSGKNYEFKLVDI